ncbi:MAG: hypothetical protein A2Y17_08120 [Clostridiales bacterium GWF2_38_85]|nr:MAG: hypothetical protein A2Y17_08120 [Clostridiales bacterium GWF2_38_85]HBL83842.1 hypothetical protein [Clostridiales bacterium]
MEFEMSIYYDVVRAGNTNGGMHQHSFYEFVFYETGIGYTTINNKKYRYTPGSLAFIPLGVDHDEFREKDSNIGVINFSYSGSLSPELKAGLYTDRDGAIYKCICKIRDEYLTSLPLSNHFVNIYCNELYLTALRSTDENILMSDSLNYVISYINRYYNDELSISKLAAMCGYSERHFRNIFKKKTGCSPAVYILKRKLDNAKRLLTYTDESIINISNNCGFCSSSQFSSLFKREFGVSPKDYRKKNEIK